MKPTVGCIVHYEDGIYGTCAAIVTNVDPNTEEVLLALFHKSPPTDDQPSLVYHWANYSHEPALNRWSWPPQKLRPLHMKAEA